MASLASETGNSPQAGQAIKVIGQAGKGPPGLPRGTALSPRQTVLAPREATPQLTPQ